jgi:ABC-type transport system involved in multi-copper enzyme maturation permease subunit
MSRLIYAEFYRLEKSIIYKLCLLFALGMPALFSIMRWYDVRKYPELYAGLDIGYSNADGLIFVCGIYLLFAMASFVAIFVGTEYSDGTIRNKLIIGHTRHNIYFSKLIVCMVADMAMYVISIISALVFGFIFINGTTIPMTEILLQSVVIIFATFAITAFLLFVSMIVTNKPISVIICIISMMIMFGMTLTVDNRLSAKQYYEPYSYIDDLGNAVVVEGEINPRYLTGTKRKVYGFLNEFMPVSQMYQIIEYENGDTLNLDRMVSCDFCIIIILTGVGLVVFKKKDLK